MSCNKCPMASNSYCKLLHTAYRKCQNRVCLFSFMKMLITHAMLGKPLQHNLHSHKNICTDILTEQNTQSIKNRLKMLPTKTKSYRKANIFIFSLKYAGHFRPQATHHFWTTHLIKMIRHKFRCWNQSLFNPCSRIKRHQTSKLFTGKLVSRLLNSFFFQSLILNYYNVKHKLLHWHKWLDRWYFPCELWENKSITVDSIS